MRFLFHNSKTLFLRLILFIMLCAPFVGHANCCPGRCCSDPSGKFTKMNLPNIPSKKVSKQAKKEVKKIKNALNQKHEAVKKHRQVSTWELCNQCHQYRQNHPSADSCCPGPCCPDRAGEPANMEE